MGKRCLPILLSTLDTEAVTCIKSPFPRAFQKRLISRRNSLALTVRKSSQQWPPTTLHPLSLSILFHRPQTRRFRTPFPEKIRSQSNLTSSNRLTIWVKWITIFQNPNFFQKNSNAATAHNRTNDPQRRGYAKKQLLQPL